MAVVGSNVQVTETPVEMTWRVTFDFPPGPGGWTDTSLWQITINRAQYRFNGTSQIQNPIQVPALVFLLSSFDTSSFTADGVTLTGDQLFKFLQGVTDQVAAANGV